MKLRLPVFLDLLPARIDEAVGMRAWRRFRVVHRCRRKAAVVPTAAAVQPPRLFVDMAVISKHDGGTGIQRVVRALALALRDAAPEQGWDIRFVSATRRRSYFEIAWPDADQGVGSSRAPDFTPIKARPGDVFLGLDYSLDTLRWHRRKLARFRRQGGRLWFLVHDLLPLQRPDWFSRNTVLRYRIWLDMLAALSEGFVCNSGQTEEELRDTLDERYGLTDGYRTQVVSMGGNILDAAAPATEAQDEVVAPRFDVSKPYYLMVGTLEPRKGHEDIVAAFDALWRSGAGTERLVLVGRQGWQVAGLVERIRSHPEYGDKLLWLDDVGDRELAAIYDGCAGVVIASYAEGFGLPLVEALEYAKPVLARDLAVFRPHEGNGVRYFPAKADTSALSRTIRLWVDDVAAGRIVVTPPEATWMLSASELLAGLEKAD